jgi:hypothetical protein
MAALTSLITGANRWKSPRALLLALALAVSMAQAFTARGQCTMGAALVTGASRSCETPCCLGLFETIMGAFEGRHL